MQVSEWLEVKRSNAALDFLYRFKRGRLDYSNTLWAIALLSGPAIVFSRMATVPAFSWSEMGIALGCASAAFTLLSPSVSRSMSILRGLRGALQPLSGDGVIGTARADLLMLRSKRLARKDRRRLQQLLVRLKELSSSKAPLLLVFLWLEEVDRLMMASN